MHVLVIGATGGIGRLLAPLLVGDGHQVRALVRDPDKAADLTAAGIEVAPGDLADPDASALTEAATGVDALVFTAGSGAATGKDMTLLIDLHGAVRAVDAAEAAGASRFVIVSSMSADDPWKGGADAAAMAPYYAAKHAADRLVVASGLDWTIVRPGRLTDEDPTGEVAVGQPHLPAELVGDRTIPRADVAAVVAACLPVPSTVGATFELLSGTTPVADAVASLTPDPPG